MPSGDHPRVCGEHSCGFLHALPDAGSSPRMRGTPRPYGRRISRCGIIPAYAGNTCGAAPKNCITGDHPRVCGEHVAKWLNGGEIPGSSPRMRGTPGRQSRQYQRAGIIPAYAGNTTIGYRRSCAGRDHPRVCGEHFCDMVFRVPLPGSSPRMRGTPSRPAGQVSEGGIIPAYAGNTVKEYR